jgi:hypothetical protein
VCIGQRCEDESRYDRERGSIHYVQVTKGCDGKEDGIVKSDIENGKDVALEFANSLLELRREMSEHRR